MRTFADLMHGDGGGGSEGGARDAAAASAPNGHGAAAAAPKSSTEGGAAATLGGSAAAAAAATRSTPLSRLAALPLLATLGAWVTGTTGWTRANVLLSYRVATEAGGE